MWLDLLGNIGGILEIFILIVEWTVQPISEHAFTCAAIQAFYLVKHSASDMIFGEAEEEKQVGEDDKKGKKVSQKKNAWKMMKNKM